MDDSTVPESQLLNRWNNSRRPQPRPLTPSDSGMSEQDRAYQRFVNEKLRVAAEQDKDRAGATLSR